MGLHRAGFEVTGVDWETQPRYPFKFIKADWDEIDYSEFDFIWASPPCQRYSDLGKRNGNAKDWPDLIPPVRVALQLSHKPYVIENVEGSPLVNPMFLCGTMFPSLRVIRHRLFESNFVIEQPSHGKHPRCHTFDKRKSHFGKTDERIDFVQVTGGGNCSVAASDAMGIGWMTKFGLNESIPPAYAEYVGRQWFKNLKL